jgi:hypothetical protein
MAGVKFLNAIVKGHQNAFAARKSDGRA